MHLWFLAKILVAFVQNRVSFGFFIFYIKQLLLVLELLATTGPTGLTLLATFF
jgi:hypothetical protein